MACIIIQKCRPLRQINTLTRRIRPGTVFILYQQQLLFDGIRVRALFFKTFFLLSLLLASVINGDHSSMIICVHSCSAYAMIYYFGT